MNPGPQNWCGLDKTNKYQESPYSKKKTLCQISLKLMMASFGEGGNALLLAISKLHFPSSSVEKSGFGLQSEKLKI